MQNQALTVKQLNFYVRSLIEGDMHLMNISVTGEISNLKNHYASGHIYFTLKDSDAAVRCVMFRSFAAKINFKPEDGMTVVIRGRASLYEKDGQYQFYAEEMAPAGEGDIAARYEQIKARLLKEGIFDAESKRPIPRFPQKIAVITSESGAAVRDIMNILTRRWPVCEIIMCPVTVQGDAAVGEMLSALDRLYNIPDIDVAIIGRGGGSAEDLWAFNDEALARKVHSAPFPVISAVGHETDFTICDFAADLRAPTPSAAAELAVPDREDVIATLSAKAAHLSTLLQGRYERCRLRLNSCLSCYYFRDPEAAIVSRRAEAADRAADRLMAAIKSRIESKNRDLLRGAAALEALSPLKTISRGFAAVKKDARPVNSVNLLVPGDMVEIVFRDGQADCLVKSVKRRNSHAKKECEF